MKDHVLARRRGRRPLLPCEARDGRRTISASAARPRVAQKSPAPKDRRRRAEGRHVFEGVWKTLTRPKRRRRVPPPPLFHRVFPHHLQAEPGQARTLCARRPFTVTDRCRPHLTNFGPTYFSSARRHEDVWHRVPRSLPHLHLFKSLREHGFMVRPLDIALFWSPPRSPLLRRHNLLLRRGGDRKGRREKWVFVDRLRMPASEGDMASRAKKVVPTSAGALP